MESNIFKTIQLLVDNPNISVSEILSNSNLTLRQLRYRISKINNLLKSKKQKMISIYKDNEIIVPKKSLSTLQLLLISTSKHERFSFDKDERIIYIFLLLFLNLDYVSLNDIMDNLRSSKSTSLIDFKALEHLLQKYDLSIRYDRTHGYYLYGNEINIRRTMMHIIIHYRFTNVYNTLIDDYHLDLYEYSRLVIKELAEKNNIQFVEDRLYEFIYIFTFLKARIQNGASAAKEISQLPNIDMMSTTKEYKFTHDLLLNYDNLENFKPVDIKYISSWILSISYGDIKEYTQDSTYLYDLVEKIMQRFELLSGSHYANTTAIFIQLYSHFRPAYYRLLFKLPIYNPLTENVKNEYSELYNLVNETMKPFTSLFGENIPDDEIAYLTMHFAAIYSNHRTTKITHHTALIVCSNGIGSSAILYNELKSLFPNIVFLAPVEASKLNINMTGVDIIFATKYANIDITNIPIIRVNPVMSAEEQYQVIHNVHMQLNINESTLPNVDHIISIVKKYAEINNLNDLTNELHTYFMHANDKPKFSNIIPKQLHLDNIIQPEFILLHQESKNWHEAIELAYQPLLKNECISTKYITSTINELEKSEGYIVIAPHIALAHSKPENGAQKIAMGICVLQKPINFNHLKNDPVKYIFSLSAIDNHTHFLCMNEFLALLTDKNFFTLLDTSNSSKEILNYINQYRILS